MHAKLTKPDDTWENGLVVQGVDVQRMRAVQISFFWKVFWRPFTQDFEDSRKVLFTLQSPYRLSINSELFVWLSSFSGTSFLWQCSCWGLILEPPGEWEVQKAYSWKAVIDKIVDNMFKEKTCKIIRVQVTSQQPTFHFHFAGKTYRCMSCSFRLGLTFKGFRHCLQNCPSEKPALTTNENWKFHVINKQLTYWTE